ncbi:hypothetical protein HYR99_10810 [Candidatus Poribacteria bacterium]|nr:hypothetical protein [Candidatus Poribacteria bacterium]
MKRGFYIQTLLFCLFAASIFSMPFIATEADESVPEETAAAVKQAIAEYVEKDSTLKGSFLLYDALFGKVQNLKFDHVHEGVHKTAAGTYFACVDFTNAQQQTLDVDVYVKPEKDDFDIAQVLIHKVDGTDRLQDAGATPEVEAAPIRQAIEDYIKKDTSLKGGFLIYDPLDKHPRHLSFQAVHQGVHKTQAGTYYACVDFLSPENQTLDLDFYLQAGKTGWNVTSILLHQVDGVDRLK